MNNTDTSSADCQFVKVPLHLFCRLDNNLRSMLFTLIQLSTYYAEEDGWFFRDCEDLQKQSNLSENLVRATLDGLYMKGLIDVKCEGKGKGRNTHPNFFKVNFERFKDYEKDDIEKCIKDPRLGINTPKYKGSHYHPSYLDKSDRVVVTETVVVEDAVNDKVDDEVSNVVENVVKSEDNIDNIYNIDNKENKDNIKNIDNKDNSKNINNIDINNNEINYDIYKDRETWHSSLPNEMNQSEYLKERIIFELYQLHDYYLILNKIEEIEKLFRRGCSDKYRERILHILNEKSNEIGFKFDIYLK
jgi:hypothetical protein